MSMYEFSEVTDLRMRIESSAGSDVGNFQEGVTVRELFVIYNGPPMLRDREKFFLELQDWMIKKHEDLYKGAYKEADKRLRDKSDRNLQDALSYLDSPAIGTIRDRIADAIVYGGEEKYSKKL